ncbi:MAG: SDR family oxidoreductase [Planctomycetia bacterium]|nr:SDR family oxidoreductase [Planctomycetia bacterium]
MNLNVLQAGLVKTDSCRTLPNREELLSHLRSRNLVGDLPLEAREVADASLFLASPLSDMMQAHTLVLDGGASVHG